MQKLKSPKKRPSKIQRKGIKATTPKGVITHRQNISCRNPTRTCFTSTTTPRSPKNGEAHDYRHPVYRQVQYTNQEIYEATGSPPAQKRSPPDGQMRQLTSYLQNSLYSIIESLYLSPQSPSDLIASRIPNSTHPHGQKILIATLSRARAESWHPYQHSRTTGPGCASAQCPHFPVNIMSPPNLAHHRKPHISPGFTSATGPTGGDFAPTASNLDDRRQPSKTIA
jgi:hypothetical protein